MPLIRLAPHSAPTGRTPGAAVLRSPLLRTPRRRPSAVSSRRSTAVRWGGSPGSTSPSSGPGHECGVGAAVWHRRHESLSPFDRPLPSMMRSACGTTAWSPLRAVNPSMSVRGEAPGRLGVNRDEADQDDTVAEAAVTGAGFCPQTCVSPKPNPCWRRSAAGSPWALTPLISRSPRRCSKNYHDPVPSPLFLL
jgi:hypothetical protein